MLSITNKYGNTNQNLMGYDCTSTQMVTLRTSHHQQQRMTRAGKNVGDWDPCTLLVGA